MYLYYGENGVRSVYFISNSVRSGRTDSHPGELKPFHYAGYTSGTMLSHQNSGMNTIISLSFGIQHRVSLNYGFGGENSLSPDRAAAGSIRCVRDE